MAVGESVPLLSQPSQPASRARDHLSNERTFLAWMRTALALIGVSIGLLKWDGVENLLGYAAALLGGVTLLMSTQRYFCVMRLLDEGRFEPNVRGIMVVVGTMVVCMVAVLALHLFHGL